MYDNEKILLEFYTKKAVKEYENNFNGENEERERIKNKKKKPKDYYKDMIINIMFKFSIIGALGMVLFMSLALLFPHYTEPQTIFDEQGVMLNTNDNQLSIEVDNEVITIDTKEDKTLFALATYEDYNGHIKCEDMKKIGSIVGSKIKIYSGKEVVYLITSKNRISYDFYKRGNDIIMIQEDKYKVNIMFNWE